MTKSLSWWLTKFHLLSTRLQNQINRSYYLRKNFPRFGLFLATLILIIGNLKLLFATVSGLGIMFVVYKWDELNWQKYWLKYIKLLQGSEKRLTLAVSSGGVIAVTTYMTAVIWTDAENRWLATGTILQGLISVTTLALLTWQVFEQKSSQNKSEFEYFLTDLSANSPLKRLRAVRYFNNLIKHNKLDSTQKQQIEEYFILMFKIESEEIICKALQENVLLSNSRETLKKPSISQQKKTLKIPLKSELFIDTLNG